MNRLTDIPRPYPDQELYKYVREKGFKIYPDREANYRKFQTAARKPRLDYLPVMLDIEPVSRCNYRCIMCEVSRWPGGRRADDMSLNDFSALLDQQYGLTEVKLQGLGEPLLGKDFFKMVRYARDKSIWVRSTTNASLLHLNENYKRLIDSDICEIQVSIDSSVKEHYKMIRRGGDFDLVMRNCEMLNTYCASISRHRTRMWTTLQKNNFHDLPNMPALAASLGFRRLTIALDLNDFGQEHWRQKNKEMDVHERITPTMIHDFRERGEKAGVEVTFWFLDEKFNTDKKENLCPWPFQRLFISSDMRIVPCCMISNPAVFDLGDAKKLTDEWNNEKIQTFRQLHLNGNIPAICKECYSKRS